MEGKERKKIHWPQVSLAIDSSLLDDESSSTYFSGLSESQALSTTQYRSCRYTYTHSKRGLDRSEWNKDTEGRSFEAVCTSSCGVRALPFSSTI